jgi:hypothetical protein
MAGHHVSCSGCGNAVLVPAANAASAAPKGAPKGARAAKPRAAGAPARKSQPSFSISTGEINLIVGTLIAAAIGITAYLGPIRTYNRWQTMRPKANAEVQDVMTFAIRAVTSQEAAAYHRKQPVWPSVDGDATFGMRILIMRLPDEIPFYGFTTQGPFNGYYRSADGEIEADMAVGGLEVGGLMSLHAPKGVIHITGRDPGGNPQAEMDGISLKIAPPVKDDSQ